MKTKAYYPAWLIDDRLIIGAEEDNSQEGSQSAANGSTDDDQSSVNEDSGGGSNSSQSGGHDDADDPKVKGLKSALEKERLANAAKDNELKELRKLKKAQEARELAEKDEVEQARIKAERATEKAEKLAAGLLKRDLNSAITSVARELKFIDPTDAISGVDMSTIVFEQDEDDPSNITIDEKTVKAAVKALLSRKPHFAKSGTDDGEATGSQFGGKQKKPVTDLKSLYPSL